MERNGVLVTLIGNDLFMKKIISLEPGGYYLFESLASGRSCYFKSDAEVKLFEVLFRRYVGTYIHIHKMYLSSEGYQILLKLKSKESILSRYRKSCERRDKAVKDKYIEEPWRIVSEQVRIFHSNYVKGVNVIRGRNGVLVQERYVRYVFDGEEELVRYIEEMDSGKEINGQKDDRYRVEEERKKGVNWGVLRGVEWVERYMGRVFQDFVVSEFVNYTKLLHSHTNPP